MCEFAISKDVLQKIVNRTCGTPLERKLTSTTFTPKTCTKRNCTIRTPTCHRTNVIYEAKCTICGEIYIGETRRELHTRITEHQCAIQQGDTQASAIAEHYSRKHPGMAIPDIPITVTVINTAKDTADRKIKEACAIRQRTPTINRDGGWTSLGRRFF